MFKKDTSLDYFYSTLTVVFGYLQASKGKVTLADTNKVLKKLGYDRMKRVDFDEATKVISNDKKYQDLAKQAIDGDVGLDDLIKSDGSYPSKSLEGSLDAILTPYQRLHQQALDNQRDFNKLSRQESRHVNQLDSIYQSLSNDIKNSDISLDLPNVVLDNNKETSLLVTASDYHVGNSYNIKGNRFNFDILKSRVQEYTEQAINYGKQLGITHLYFIHLGDLIEGINMRATNQAYFDEFTYSEQVSNGIKLLVWQLQQFTKYFKVTFGVVEGNHDRSDGNKKSAVYGDGAMLIVLNQIQLLLENKVFNNLEILDNHDDIYNLEFDINGKHIFCTHGETIKRNASDNIAKHTRQKKIDLLVGGHYHNFHAQEENNSSMTVIAGSMKGYDMYSKSLNLCDSVASQLMVAIQENSLDLKTVWL